MKEQDPKEPTLRVLPQEGQSRRLEPSAGEAVPQGERIDVLKPDEKSRLEAKLFEPDLSEILGRDVVEVDSEAACGSEMKKAPPLGWLVLAGLIVCGLALWGVVTVYKPQPRHREVVEEKKELEVDYAKEKKAVRHTLDQMKECVRGYLTAKSVEEKLLYVRHSSRVKPLMESYYKNHSMEQKDFRHFERIHSMDLDGLSFVYGKVGLLSGENHELLLEQLEDGIFRVDWESDVCYLPVEWDDYLETSPTKLLEMRVYIKPDHFYAYEFRDEARFDSYKLTTRDSDDHLFAFVEKKSEVAADIKRFIKRSEGDEADSTKPLILQIRFPEDSHSKKCVWIDRLIAPRWTYVRSPESKEEE